MTGTPFNNQRKRTLLGLAVVAMSIVLAVGLAGISFAAGNSPTAAASPAQAQYGKPKPVKITICHHRSAKKHPWVTLRIPVKTWKAHAKHGDFKGKCTAAKIKKAQKKLNAKKHRK
jgi:hypothetical protein